MLLLPRVRRLRLRAGRRRVVLTHAGLPRCNAHRVQVDIRADLLVRLGLHDNLPPTELRRQGDEAADDVPLEEPGDGRPDADRDQDGHRQAEQAGTDVERVRDHLRVEERPGRVERTGVDRVGTGEAVVRAVAVRVEGHLAVVHNDQQDVAESE